MVWRFDRVFLTRHGETEWNVERRRQGQLDSPLTAVGRQQAMDVARVLRTRAPDALFSSPLGRAYDSALVVGAETGLDVVVLEELAELHHGDFAGLTNDEIAVRHPGVLEHRETDKYNWRFPGGESYRDAAERATRALDAVTAAGSTTPAIVTHEMIGRMLLAALVGSAPAEALATDLPHGAVVEITPTTTEFTAHQTGAMWRAAPGDIVNR